VQLLGTNIAPYSIELKYADGYFGGCKYKSANLISFLNLIECSTALNEKMFFEVERIDKELVFQVYYETGQFCLFQDTYQKKILVSGPKPDDIENVKFKQVWDERWPLTYFLPLISFTDSAKFKSTITDVLEHGVFGEHYEFAQLFLDQTQ